LMAFWSGRMLEESVGMREFGVEWDFVDPEGRRGSGFPTTGVTNKTGWNVNLEVKNGEQIEDRNLVCSERLKCKVVNWKIVIELF
jgi:hypothetical protein